MRRRRLLAGVAAVVLLALAFRLGPLYWSPLPFNPDGFAHANVAEDLLATGTFQFESVATDQVGFPSMLAVFSALAGESPLGIGQPASAFVGALSVLVGVVLARRLALAAGWDRPRANAAGLLAGCLLAVEGVYLYRSMATDEQTAVFLLVGALALAAERWIRSGEHHWGVVAVVVLVPLGPLHNLSGLVGASGVTVVAGLCLLLRPSRWVAARGAVGTVLAWAIVIGYHLGLERYAGAEIVQAERLVAVPGLFVAWIVLAVLGASWFLTTGRRTQRWSVLAVILGGFGLLGLNALRPLYPGTTETPVALLVWLLPLTVAGVVAGLAAHRAATSSTWGPATIALVAGPLAFVGTGLTAGLTFEYLSMVWRAQLFVHLPLLAVAAVGTVALARRCPGDRLQGLLVAVVLASVLASAPLAYAELDVRTFKGTTTEADFAAAAHVAGSDERVATDDHLARIVGYHGGNGDRTALFDWLRAGGDPPDCPTLARASWTESGAQLHPQRPATIAPATLEEWRLQNDVSYVVLAESRLFVVEPRSGVRAGC